MLCVKSTRCRIKPIDRIINTRAHTRTHKAGPSRPTSERTSYTLSAAALCLISLFGWDSAAAAHINIHTQSKRRQHEADTHTTQHTQQQTASCWRGQAKPGCNNSLRCSELAWHSAQIKDSYQAADEMTDAWGAISSRDHYNGAGWREGVGWARLSSKPLAARAWREAFHIRCSI